MNKELQDKAWAMLPKEFREEVKKEYYDCLHCNADISALELEIVFSKHNLTSDTEPKFNVRDKVLISDDPRIGKDFRGRIGTVVFICSSDKCIVDVGNRVVPECFHISHLAPVPEPKSENALFSESAKNENNGNHIVGSENKQLRIMVAAEVMKGILCNTNIVKDYKDLDNGQEYVAKRAVAFTDALLEEIKKDK